MANGTVSSGVIRFGAFEVNLTAGEILQHGVKLKLQGQPFQLLAALLERPGEVVSRDELYRRIWAKHTFVDFERGLNKAINRLREALGDSPEHPAFIETLARRGYRFIAPIKRRLGSIAVLPLENLSGDPNQDHWADGMTDELIVQLAKISGLRVVSRGSAMRFKGARRSVPEIARRLGADAVIEGSVVVSGGRVRIRTQLIEASGERHLWAGCHDRELGDVLALQQEIAQEVARTIHARLTPEDERRLANARHVIPEAYESYVKGRHFWNKRTEPDFDRSIEHFNRAIALDPGYAAPYVGLSDAHIMLGIFGLRCPRELYIRAKAAAETALSLDETLGDAHKSLAALQFFYEWDPRGAEWHCRRAIELDPNSGSSHQWYGIILACLRRHDEAIGEMKRARDLDPLSIPINGLLALSYIHARRYQEAIQASRSAVELDTNNPFGHWLLARSLDANNELGDALAEAELACSLSGGNAPFRPYLGYAYGRSGDRLRAQEVLRQLEECQRTKYVSPHDIGLIYTALGERDLAFEWLEKAFAERTFRICEVFNPSFDSLCCDARFQDLVCRIGIWSQIGTARGS